jgi:hypothetical protein
MPPPLLGRKPYGTWGRLPFDDHDPWGLPVTEYEEAWQLRPGLERLAHKLVSALVKLGQGRQARGISRHKLHNNPCWSEELNKQAGSLRHERYVVLLPLALSRTQDDKGRVRWTLFGGSEQGPARAFWKGFFTAPGKEVPPEQALAFIRGLLAAVYGEPAEALQDLSRAGFRILPRDKETDFPYWAEDPWPSWTAPYLWSGSGSLDRVKYVLTFRPFAALPASVRRAYLAGNLHLLPFPGSLAFWGAPHYITLQRQLPLAMQIPLQHMLDRCEDPYGIRVPQSGWLHEPGPGRPLPPLHGRHLRQTYQRTHRWNRTHRHQDELDVLDDEDKVAHVLFATAPDDLGLYDKPMARNAQVWTQDDRLLLDGPTASREDIKRAALHLADGGLFGYRFQFPAMRLGRHELYWHLPLAAYRRGRTNRAALLGGTPLGYITAYPADRPDPAHPVELWPRLLRREPHLMGLELLGHEPAPHWTNQNLRKLLHASELFAPQPLPASYARALLIIPKQESLDQWLEALPGHTRDPGRAGELVAELRRRIAGGLDPGPDSALPQPPGLTLECTGRRSFEVAYWKTIALLAHGQFRNKDNADCVLDKVTQSCLAHPHRDLEALGDFLIGHYQHVIAGSGLTGDAWVGEHAFNWRTDFDFSWQGGWLNNQSGRAYERNIVVRIPGKDPGQAVIMADHYDTAYMYDHFDPEYGGTGARLAASGADDNHSATAALMLAAPVFLELSRAGKLACDVWLVHLTGEEFPSDCLGARHLCQDLVQGTLKVRLAGERRGLSPPWDSDHGGLTPRRSPDGPIKDLGKVRIKGVYVSDMIAHNNDHDRDVFQISPGLGRESAWLSLQAHYANELWNAWARAGNRRAPRKGAGRGRRSPDALTLPELARFPVLHGEVRPPLSPRSTLYNTDGQIFSDAGVPVVLFMENYDINRAGYHDSQDTLANIDLDYGAALAAIVIESVARAAVF